MEVITQQKLIGVLKQIPLFAGLSDDNYVSLANLLKEQTVPANTDLFHTGDKADRLFVIGRGEVRIVQQLNDVENEIILQDHDFFGEMGLLSNNSRNAHAQTRTDCLLYTMSYQDFQKLIDTMPEFSEKIAGAYVQRARQTENVKRLGDRS